MIKILAVDTSTTSTGWAVYEDSEYVNSGYINLKRSKLDKEKRVDMMCRELFELFKEEKPDIIVIEKVSVNRNLDTVRKLSRVVDVCYLYTLLLGNVRFHEYAPSEWRSAIGIQRWGVGRAAYKQMAQLFANKFFKKENVFEDEADAICIGAAYVSEYLNMNKYRVEKGEINEWYENWCKD